MRNYRLPGTSLVVSSLGMGAGGFGTQTRGAELDRLAAAFLDAGGRLFDTAHCYAFWMPGGLGASERALGECLRRLGARDGVVVATKGGHPDMGPDYRRPDAYLSPEVVSKDLSESLERLGDPCVDLYFLHRDDPRVPVGEIVDMLNQEVAAGRVRHLGASNWSTARLAQADQYAAAHGLRGFAVSQLQWSLAVPTWPLGDDPIMRWVTDDDAGWYAGSGVPVFAYSSTANGFFSDGPAGPGAYDTPANLARRDRAHALAGQLGCSPTQVALAYLLHQRARVVPLFSTTRLEHLSEACAADDISLTEEQVRWLRDG